jgi:hypothetical protein
VRHGADKLDLGRAELVVGHRFFLWDYTDLGG